MRVQHVAKARYDRLVMSQPDHIQTVEIRGHTMTQETQFSVSGERGRFRFRYVNTDGSVNCYGGTLGRERLRDFRVERITKIHKPKRSDI
jgi:hypothetical protein